MTDEAVALGVPESHADLLSAPLTAVLTTNGTDGTSMDPPNSERAIVVFRPRHVVAFG